MAHAGRVTERSLARGVDPRARSSTLGRNLEPHVTAVGTSGPDILEDELLLRAGERILLPNILDPLLDVFPPALAGIGLVAIDNPHRHVGDGKVL
jgi:hypothetical protein